jgi:hypothetical protein
MSEKAFKLPLPTDLHLKGNGKRIFSARTVSFICKQEKKRGKWSRTIPEESSFCEICEEISEGNMIKCMSSKNWTDD